MCHTWTKTALKNCHTVGMNVVEPQRHGEDIKWGGFKHLEATKIQIVKSQE